LYFCLIFVLCGLFLLGLPVCSASSERNNSKPANDVFFDGGAIRDLFDMFEYEIPTSFGDAKHEDWWDGAYFYSYDEMVFFCYEGNITSIWFTNPSNCEFDGINLNMNRDEIVKVFGEPLFEGEDEESESYRVNIDIGDYTLKFEMDTPGNKPRHIEVYPNWDVTDKDYGPTRIWEDWSEEDEKEALAGYTAKDSNGRTINVGDTVRINFISDYVEGAVVDIDGNRVQVYWINSSVAGYSSGHALYSGVYRLGANQWHDASDLTVR